MIKVLILLIFSLVFSSAQFYVPQKLSMPLLIIRGFLVLIAIILLIYALVLIFTTDILTN